VRYNLDWLPLLEKLAPITERYQVVIHSPCRCGCSCSRSITCTIAATR
jgi:hypothetical protein